MKDCTGVIPSRRCGSFAILENTFSFNDLNKRNAKLRTPYAPQRGQRCPRPAESGADLPLSNNAP